MIVAWLKIYQKPHQNIDLILHNLDLWISIFKNQKIIIYNENVILPEKYYQYWVINRKEILDSSEECQNLQERIATNKILDKVWMPVATALSFPYYFCNEDYIWNIDANDITVDGNYFDQILPLLNKYNLPQLSLDLYMLANKQWSFGVCLSNRLAMKQIINTVLDIPIPRDGWGINLDGMITKYLFKQNIPYFSYTTPDWVCHEGPVNTGLCSRFNIEKNMMETNFYGKRTQFGPLHPKVLLIKPPHE